MSKSICSEVQIENPRFKLKIGTTNKKNPKTFYVEGGIFVTPTVGDSKEMTYQDKIDNVHMEMMRGIQEMIQSSNRPMGKNFIAFMDVADERMKVGKKTYLTFQYYIQQNGDILPFPDIIENSANYTEHVLDKIVYALEQNNFEMSKSKKI